MVNNGFLKAVLVLVNGAGLAQLINILMIPILSKLYSPVEFSQFASFAALVAISASIICFRYELAIAIPKKNVEASYVYQSSLVICIVNSVSLLVLSILSEALGLLSGPFVYIFPLAVFFSGLYNSAMFFSVRHKDYFNISASRLKQAVASNLSQVVIGFSGFTSLGLHIGFAVNPVVGFINLFRGESRNLSLKKFVYVLRRYVNFFKYSVVETLLNVSSMQLPIVIIAVFSLGGDAGFLFLAIKFIGAPLQLVGNSISQVYISNAKDYLYGGGLFKYTFNIMAKLVLLSLIPFVLVYLYIDIFIETFFDVEWWPVSLYVKLLIPMFFVQFVTSPVSLVLQITGEQQAAMFLQIFGFVLRVIGLLIVGQYMQQYIVEYFAVSGAVFYVIYCILVVLVVRKHDEKC